jgi:outer membrane lipoprotein-sorting protein
MQIKHLKAILVLALVVWGLTPGLARAAEFSATVVSRQDSKESRGKVYLQGPKLRREENTPEGLTITIARQDRGVMWLLVPGQQKYMEIPLAKSDLGQVMAMPRKATQMKPLGKEMVSGYETEKFETTVKGEGRTARVYLWVSKKLGVPIKMASVDGKSSMEYRDIKEGGVPPAIFEIPPGYQKTPLPQMPKGKPQKK